MRMFTWAEQAGEGGGECGLSLLLVVPGKLLQSLCFILFIPRKLVSEYNLKSCLLIVRLKVRNIGFELWYRYQLGPEK